MNVPATGSVLLSGPQPANGSAVRRIYDAGRDSIHCTGGNDGITVLHRDLSDLQQTPKPKLIMVRFTGESLRQIYYDMGPLVLWKDMTHLIFEHVMPEGTPIAGRRLTSCRTLAPLLKSIVQANPHLKVIHALTNEYRLSLQEPKELLTIESAFKFVRRLCKIIDQYKPDYFELDLDILRKLWRYPAVWHQLMMCCKFLVTNDLGSLDRETSSLLKHMVSNDYLFRLILKSYGFLNVKYVKTTHGTYQHMHVNSDSAVKYFTDQLDEYVFIPTNLMLMEIDTCGVEYLTAQYETNRVQKFKVCPLRIIHERLRLDKNNRENCDITQGACIVEFPKDRVYISYDNPAVRQLKFETIIKYGIGGVVLGELTNDIYPISTRSLFRQTVTALGGQVQHTL